MLHALKYHKSDCLGVLLGSKVEAEGKRTVVIDDAIPLFHTRVMSGALEIAFEMIESTMVTNTKKIVGVYEAPITATDTLQIPTQMAVAVATQIKSQGHFGEPCVVSVCAGTSRLMGS